MEPAEKRDPHQVCHNNYHPRILFCPLSCPSIKEAAQSEYVQAMLSNSEEGSFEQHKGQSLRQWSKLPYCIKDKQEKVSVQFLRLEEKKDPMLSFILPLPKAISSGGNCYERRAFRNKHEIQHGQEGTYWLENFPVLVKALFPIQPNTQVLPAFFNLHRFFNQLKHSMGRKASKNLLPNLLCCFSKEETIFWRG